MQTKTLSVDKLPADWQYGVMVDGPTVYGTGPELLRAALDGVGLTQMKLEEVLPTAAGLVSRWLAGLQRPGLALAFKLERLFEIPVEAWIHRQELEGFEERIAFVRARIRGMRSSLRGLVRLAARRPRSHRGRLGGNRAGRWRHG